MWQLNHAFNLSLEKTSAWPLLMPTMVPDLMYVPEVSGLFVRMLSLMSGCFILMLPATDQENSRQYTRDMKMRRNESMVSEFWTLNMECSPHLFCPRQVAWGGKLQHFTSAWQTCYLAREISPTALSWAG